MPNYAAVKQTMKLRGVLRWKYFLFGIRENSPKPQNLNGKSVRRFMDSIDPRESIFCRQPALVFRVKDAGEYESYFSHAQER